MGWPLFGLGLISAAYALWKRTAADVMLLSYALANYIVISSTTSESLYYPRYALPIILVMAILSGRALAATMHAKSRHRVVGGYGCRDGMYRRSIGRVHFDCV